MWARQQALQNITKGRRLVCAAMSFTMIGRDRSTAGACEEIMQLDGRWRIAMQNVSQGCE
jgi:hypothetical protein